MRAKCFSNEFARMAASYRFYNMLSTSSADKTITSASSLLEFLTFGNTSRILLIILPPACLSSVYKRGANPLPPPTMHRLVGEKILCMWAYCNDKFVIGLVQKRQAVDTEMQETVMRPNIITKTRSPVSQNPSRGLQLNTN